MTFPFPIDPQLTGVVVAYRNGAYIADRVLPRIGPPLPTRDFRYLKFGFGQQITIPNTNVGRKGTPNEVEFEVTEVPATVTDYGLDDTIPADDVSNAPRGYDPVAFAAQRLADLVALDRERRVAGTIFAAGTYPAANKTALSGTSQWSDPASTPIVDIQDAMDSMVQRPNVAVLGRGTWTALRRHPSIVSAISVSGTTSGVATIQAVADLLEVDDIIVGEAWVNTARRGQAVTRARLWGNHAALLSLNPLASSTAGLPTFGWTAEYATRIAGQMPEPKVGLRGSTRVRVGESVAEVIAANDLGFFFEDAVA